MKTPFFILCFIVGSQCAPEPTSTKSPVHKTTPAVPESTPPAPERTPPIPEKTPPVPETMPQLPPNSTTEIASESIDKSEEVFEIQIIVNQHVLDQANIPISFHMQNPVTPFIGRSGELSNIKWTHMDHKMAVITGPRGVGKSELSKKYAQEFKHDNTSSTIWLDSGSHESLISSFKDLAVTVGIQVESKPVTSLIREVVAHFNNRKTLIILDNAEDGNVLVKNMPSFIGNSKFIFIVVTSRQSDWNHKRFKVLPLNVFTSEESKEYLKLKLGKGINVTAADDNCLKLAETLSHLPLALSEAVAYISQQNSLNPQRSYGIEDFLAEFKGKVIAVQPPTDIVVTDQDIEAVLAMKLAKEAKRVANQVNENADSWAKSLSKEVKMFMRRFRKKLGYNIDMNKE